VLRATRRVSVFLSCESTREYRACSLSLLRVGPMMARQRTVRRFSEGADAAAQRGSSWPVPITAPFRILGQTRRAKAGLLHPEVGVELSVVIPRERDDVLSRVHALRVVAEVMALHICRKRAIQTLVGVPVRRLATRTPVPISGTRTSREPASGRCIDHEGGSNPPVTATDLVLDRCAAAAVVSTSRTALALTAGHRGTRKWSRRLQEPAGRTVQSSAPGVQLRREPMYASCWELVREAKRAWKS
jgi:hypothetical protein